MKSRVFEVSGVGVEATISGVQIIEGKPAPVENKVDAQLRSVRRWRIRRTGQPHARPRARHRERSEHRRPKGRSIRWRRGVGGRGKQPHAARIMLVSDNRALAEGGVHDGGIAEGGGVAASGKLTVRGGAIEGNTSDASGAEGGSLAESGGWRSSNSTKRRPPRSKTPRSWVTTSSTTACPPRPAVEPPKAGAWSSCADPRLGSPTTPSPTTRRSPKAGQRRRRDRHRRRDDPRRVPHRHGRQPHRFGQRRARERLRQRQRRHRPRRGDLHGRTRVGDEQHDRRQHGRSQRARAAMARSKAGTSATAASASRTRSSPLAWASPAAKTACSPIPPPPRRRAATSTASTSAASTPRATT